MYQQVKISPQKSKISNPFVRSLVVQHGLLPQAIPTPAWGIDPGVDFGLTYIEKDKVYVFHGSLISDPTPGRQGLITFRFLQDFFASLPWPRIIGKMVIEGAAYGAPFRQVELSEIRTGFYLAATLSGVFDHITITPPKTIRKAVFGDGRVQAGDEYPTLNHNAADSLAMALYAAQYTKE